MNSHQTSSSSSDLQGDSSARGPDDLCTKCLGAIEMLRRARLYAADTERDAWDFAIEATSLERMGLTTTDFRWLTCKEYVRHGVELSKPGSPSRSFRKSTGLSFETRTCFVLTAKGLEFANSILAPSRSLCDVPGRSAAPSTSAAAAPSPPDSKDSESLRPHWDCDSRELRFQGHLVKQFKVPSPNQEIVIMSFEEEQWPTCIDDPLPNHNDRDPKQRLHDTIRSLNRNQKNRLLRFKGNGTGQGILWEPIIADDREE